MWQAQRILHLAKNEKNVKASLNSRRGSAKMHVAWQGQKKSHIGQAC